MSKSKFFNRTASCLCKANLSMQLKVNQYAQNASAPTKKKKRTKLCSKMPLTPFKK